MHEGLGEAGSRDVGNGFVDDKSGEVAHGGQEVRVASCSVLGFAGGPKINGKDEERRADGPGKEKFAVSADVFTSGDAVSALTTPVDDVLPHVRPKEAEAKAVEGLVLFEMTGSRGSMKGGEDSATKGTRDDNEHELAVELEMLVDDEAMVDEACRVGVKVAAEAAINGFKFFLWPGCGWLAAKAAADDVGVRVVVVSDCPVRRCW